MSKKSYAVRLTKDELWGALSAIEGIWETERTDAEKAALQKLWAAYQKARAALKGEGDKT